MFRCNHQNHLARICKLPCWSGVRCPSHIFRKPLIVSHCCLEILCLVCCGSKGLLGYCLFFQLQVGLFLFSQLLDWCLWLCLWCLRCGLWCCSRRSLLLQIDAHHDTQALHDTRITLHEHVDHLWVLLTHLEHLHELRILHVCGSLGVRCKLCLSLWRHEHVEDGGLALLISGALNVGQT